MSTGHTFAPLGRMPPTLSSILKRLNATIERMGEIARLEPPSDVSTAFVLQQLCSKLPSEEHRTLLPTGTGAWLESRQEHLESLQRGPGDGLFQVEEVCEPVINVYEDEDDVVLIAEMPGTVQPDIRVCIDNDLLTLTATRGACRYHKEVTLPRDFPQEGAIISCSDGLVEIRLPG